MSAKAIREADGKRILAKNLPDGCPGRDNLLAASYSQGELWETLEAAHPFVNKKASCSCCYSHCYCCH